MAAGSYRKTKKAVRKAQRAGLLEAGRMFQKWRKTIGKSKTGKRVSGIPNPPLNRWLKVQGSPVKQIRFRKGGNVDVVIVGTGKHVVRSGNPISAEKEKLYHAAVKADERLQKALEKKYGSRSGDMRYRTSELPANIRHLAMAYQRAAERYRTANPKRKKK